MGMGRDAELQDALHLLQTGNLNELFENHYDLIQRLAKKILQGERLDKHTSSLVHDLFIKWSADHALTTREYKKFVGFTCTVLSRLLIDEARKAVNSTQHHTLLDSELAPTRPKLTSEMRNAIEELSKISLRQAAVAWLKLEGYSFQEIADGLEIAEKTARRAWSGDGSSGGAKAFLSSQLALYQRKNVSKRRGGFGRPPLLRT